LTEIRGFRKFNPIILGLLHISSREMILWKAGSFFAWAQRLLSVHCSSLAQPRSLIRKSHLRCKAE
jgi:hypothetical protein